MTLAASSSRHPPMLLAEGGALRFSSAHYFRMSFARIILACGCAGGISACSHQPAPGDAMAPDVYPAGTKVVLNVRSGTPSDSIELGPKATQLFLKMLAQPSIHTEISSMPALPLGYFTVNGNRYSWHGNAVTRGIEAEERLWSGPFMQRLIRDYGNAGYQNAAAILATIEKDPAVESTSVEGPGAYPRGTDALHPNTGGVRIFTPAPQER